MRTLIPGLLPILVAVAPLPAMADAFLLPSGPLIGDGKTASTVRVWIPDMTLDEKLKIKADQGRVGVPNTAPGGMLSFTWIAPKVTTASTVNIQIQRRGAVVRDEMLQIPVVPAFEGKLKIAFDPANIVAGAGTVLVRITPSQATPQAASARRFLLSASVGTIESATPAGDGSWVARYTPPAELPGPRTVIVTAADAASPDTIFGWAALPIKVRMPVTVQVEPEASVLINMAGRTFGPVVASPIGSAAIPVELDPAVATANVQAVTKTGMKTNTVLNLPRPEYNRVAIVPLPATVPADPARVSLPVRVVATDFMGAPVRDVPTLRASSGTITPLAPASEPGVYLATFTPASSAGDAILTAEFAGSKAETTVKMVPSLPKMDIYVEPQEIAKNKFDFTVTVRVKDSGGTSLPGRPPVLTIPEATATKPLKDNGDGTYTGLYKLTKNAARASIFAAPPIATSNLAVHRLLLWPRTTVGPADGQTKVVVNVVAVDRFGLPVPDVAVSLAVPKGDAAMAPSVRTDAQGLAQVEMKLGTQEGLVTLKAETAGIVAESPFFQMKAGSAMPTLDPVGDQDSIDMLARWQSAISFLTVQKEGGAAVVGPPANVMINTIPPYTTPGAAILATLRVTDAGGSPIPKAKPKVQTSVGTVGVVTDNGDGSYNVPVQLPPGQDGPITLSVSAGSAIATTTLNTFVSTLQAAAANPVEEAPASKAGPRAGATATSSGRTAKVKQAKVVDQGDVPRLRVQGGLMLLTHDYHMTAITEPTNGEAATAPSEGEFMSGNVFKGSFGGAPGAALLGLYHVLDTDFWAQADLGMAYETMNVVDTDYSDVALDIGVAGRYRRPISEKAYYYGMAGYRRTGGLLFRYGDETRSTAELLTYPVNGLELGGGAGIEGGNGLWLEGELNATFAILPVMYDLRLQAAYDFGVNTYAFFSFTQEGRSMKFGFDETGEEVRVKDQRQPLVLGIGGVFR